MLTEIICAHCGGSAMKLVGGVNRARRNGALLYCGRECFGLARRSGKPREQIVAEKSAYDRARLNGPLRKHILAAKAAYFRRTYDPVKAAEYRHARMPYHVEYCRQPEYRAKKSEYDKKHRAEKEFGDFAGAAMLLREIEGEIASRMTKYEIYSANGTLNKRLARRRASANPVSL
jgi:hypothetical protein